jgi:four helix bundle protein
VEGCARSSEKDYLHFLDIAYGSALEVEYQLSLAYRLGYLDCETHTRLDESAKQTAKALNGLIRSLRKT